MGFLKRLFSAGNNSASFARRMKVAKELHGLPVRYVTERRGGNDDVIGRGGHLTLKGEEFLVDSGDAVLFRCPVREMEASYLMSGDGVILRGPNAQDEGRVHTLTVHFVYYRK